MSRQPATSLAAPMPSCLPGSRPFLRARLPNSCFPTPKPLATPCNLSMVPAPTSFDTTDEPRGAVDTATDAAESSDSDTSSIEPIIQYATESPSSDLSAAPLSGEGHTTRKGRDYRPPSTFLRKPRKSMTLAERICALAKAPEELHFIKTVDRGPMPSQSLLRENFFILSRAVVPLLIQAASHWAFPSTFGRSVALNRKATLMELFQTIGGMRRSPTYSTSRRSSSSRSPSSLASTVGLRLLPSATDPDRPFFRRLRCGSGHV